MKTYLYVDTENVGLNSMLNMLKLNIPQLTIYYIYTNSSPAITLRDIDKFAKAKPTLKYVYAQNGTKNAADFVLVSELTRQVVSAPKSLHIVCSSDAGYSPAIKHLRSTVCGHVTRCIPNTSVVEYVYKECLKVPQIKESYLQVMGGSYL